VDFLQFLQIPVPFHWNPLELLDSCRNLWGIKKYSVCIATEHNGRRCAYVQLGGQCPEVAEQRVGDALLGVRHLKFVPSPDGFPGLKRDPETDRRFTR